jgi:hypothetical protein
MRLACSLLEGVTLNACLVGEEDKAEQGTASVETGWTKRKDGLVTGKSGLLA